MKIKIFLMSAFILLSLQSCNNWLDVTPKDTIDEEDMFKVATGYRNALNGIYQQLSSNSLYGKELSWGMLDVLGQTYTPYTLGSGHAYHLLANKYDYKSEKTKPYIESVWTKTYNTIANCNNIVGRIEDENKSKFKGGQLEKDMIKGEVIAIRAFLHLDMLRLFAAAPIIGSQEAYIPYYDKYPSLGESNISVKEVLVKVIADLKVAQALVKPFDADSENDRTLLFGINRFFIASSSLEENQKKELFYMYRGYRMNYYAITAMLARAYNYSSEHELAEIEAQKVIDASISGGSSFKLFGFTTSEESKSNRKLTDDLIFTLANSKLQENYLPYYVGAGDDYTHTPLYLNINGLFNDGADSRKNLYDTGDRGYRSLKNLAQAITSNNSKMCQDMVPIIRMSEMYFIIAESYAAKGDFVAANNAIDVVRVGRNCTKDGLWITDENSFRSELIREVRREFFGEGQLFYYYKKFNISTSWSMPEEAFILPRPESDIIN